MSTDRSTDRIIARIDRLERMAYRTYVRSESPASKSDRFQALYPLAVARSVIRSQFATVEV